MSGRRSDYEEKLLTDLLTKYQSLGIVIWGEIEGAPGTYAEILVKSDGTVKVEGVTTISGTVDVSDRWARQLGQVDIARYLGSAIGLANPLHSQIIYGGAVIDPRSIRALVSTDIVTAYGSQTQALLQRATTYDLIVQLRTAGVEYDARQIRALTSSDVVDVSDKATRLLGVVYGSQAQQLLQRATTYDLIVQLRSAGVEIDPRSIRALISSDIVTVYGSQTQALLQRSATYDLIVQLRSAGSEIDPREYAPPSTLLVGSKTVSATGTPEALASSTTVKNSVLIQAKSTNTASVYIGNSSFQYVELRPVDATVVIIDNLATIYVKVDVNGEGVNYMGS